MENPFQGKSLDEGPVNSPAPSEDLGERLQSLGKVVAAEAGKKKRGRPPLPRDSAGNPIPTGTKSGGVHNKKSGSSNVAAALSPPEETPVIDKRIVEEAVSALLATVDGVVKDAVGASAIQLTESKPMTDNLVARVAMRPGEKDLIAKLTALVTEQYGIAGQHAPLFLLGLTATVYGGRVFFVLRSLRQIAELKARLDKKPGSQQIKSE